LPKSDMQNLAKLRLDHMFIFGIMKI